MYLTETHVKMIEIGCYLLWTFFALSMAYWYYKPLDDKRERSEKMFKHFR